MTATQKEDFSIKFDPFRLFFVTFSAKTSTQVMPGKNLADFSRFNSKNPLSFLNN